MAKQIVNGKVLKDGKSLQNGDGVVNESGDLEYFFERNGIGYVIDIDGMLATYDEKFYIESIEPTFDEAGFAHYTSATGHTYY